MSTLTVSIIFLAFWLTSSNPGGILTCSFHCRFCIIFISLFSIKWCLSIPLPLQRISAHTLNQSIMPITLPDDVPIHLVITAMEGAQSGFQFPALIQVACRAAQLSIFAPAMISTCFIQRSMPIALPDDVPISLVIIQYWKVPNLASNSSHASKSCHWISFDCSDPIHFSSVAPHQHP